MRYSHIDFSFGDEYIPKKTIDKGLSLYSPCGYEVVNLVLKKIAKDEGKKTEVIQLSDDDEVCFKL